jgi:hypothetical protein
MAKTALQRVTSTNGAAKRPGERSRSEAALGDVRHYVERIRLILNEVDAADDDAADRKRSLALDSGATTPSDEDRFIRGAMILRAYTLLDGIEFTIADGLNEPRA